MIRALIFKARIWRSSRKVILGILVVPPLIECETLASVREHLWQEEQQNMQPGSYLADSSELVRYFNRLSC